MSSAGPGFAAAVAPTLEEIEAARERIAGLALRTPLVRLRLDDAPAEVYLKLENLQPIGSFKIRGAGSAMRALPRERLARGVFTASAGNMAQGVAWVARELGVPCSVVMPEGAPRTKLEAVRRLGARPVQVPFERWWRVLVERRFEDWDAEFIHPVSDPAVMAGNGTIGLEIAEDLPEVDAVVVPYGGGGLSCGIAAALAHAAPRARVYAAEVATAAPFAAALVAGQPQRIDMERSFVDGIGSGGLLEEMWPLARRLLAGSLLVDLDETACAVRHLLERQRVIAEGAGAVSLAAALNGSAGRGRVVCVISGGNLDSTKLQTILRGETPAAN